jgi:tRNA(Ile)-lysidine synthase
MLEALKAFVQKENLFHPNQKILLGVSGGIDSVVMADLFYRSGFQFGIVHCNFKLRGKDADEDEIFVEKLASKYEVPFYVKSFDTAGFAKKNTISIQMAARDLRYRFFNDLLQSQDFHFIATAHHHDDQIETFFINFLRGTGIAGLHGILPKTNKLLRPLLFAGRSEIEHYAKQSYIAYREDKSNQEVKYLRNKIRHKLLPVLAELNQDYRQAFNKNFKHIRDVEKVYNYTIDNLKNKIFEEDEFGSKRISIDALLCLNPLHTILYEMLSPFDFNAATVEQIVDGLAENSGKQYFSSSHKIIKDRDELILNMRLEEKTEGYYSIDEDITDLEIPLNLKISIEPFDTNYVLPVVPEIASIDLNKLSFPLVLRKWCEGDWFQPLGMKGRKKVSDYFIDAKLPIDQKKNTWLLISDGEIVWVVGHRLDDRFKITRESTSVYCIQFIKKYK